jgi:hypothetical protein
MGTEDLKLTAGRILTAVLMVWYATEMCGQLDCV